MRDTRPHILVACVIAVVLLIGSHRSLQNALTDLRFVWFPLDASAITVLVAIDPPSIDKMGAWPWPRERHGELIEQLTRAGASDIVLDIDFSAPSNPVSDAAFAAALNRAGQSVVLPTFKQWVRTGDQRLIHINRPWPEFERESWSALVNVAVEPDGLVRRYPFGEPLDGQFVPSVGALIAGKYETAAPPLWIDFSIRADSIPMVSYADVLRGESAALQKLKGKKVLVGGTAIELGDRISVPNGQIMPGPLLQLLAAESIIQDRILRPVPGAATAGLVLLALLMALLWRRRSVAARVAGLVAFAVVAEAAATLLQVKYAVILETALWQIAISAYLVAVALDEIDFRTLLGGVAERRFQRIAMSLGDGLVCTDRSGLVTVWNPGARELFGYRDDEMLGQPLARILETNGAPFSIAEQHFGKAVEAIGRVLELDGRRKDGSAFPIEATISRWEGTDGHQYGALLRDVSARKREAERVRYLAEHDTLTDLANRYALYEHLRKVLTAAKEQQRQIALLVLDLDKFKQINDNHGHASGDRLLCDVAQRLGMIVEKGDVVARLSGDEFAIVIGGDDVPERARRLAERISLTFRKIAFFIEEREIRINASIGVATYPDYGSTVDELFGNADLALYRAKSAGRGRHVFFEHSLREEVEKRAHLEAELAGAIDNKELELFYQPQVALKDGRLAGAEVLIRWRHPHRGLLPPAEFMAVIDSSPMSSPVANWVLEAACRQGRAWCDLGHRVRLGVNLSPSQLQAGDLAATVAAALERTGFAPELLELEVTENILLSDDDITRDTFRRIRELGVHIVFDDFGTGYASLTYLKKFALNGLKIDQSFVRGLGGNSDDAAIVGSTVSLGKMLGLHIVAEGIESAAVAEVLRTMGCDEGQGYHFGAPMPAGDFAQKFLTAKAATGVAA
ncbi:MAG: EAL domain-containing protein [Xanthobacteraceae bacterium]|nr:EAL domain-containing protein [Xanthobacteraceae bacterium]